MVIFKRLHAEFKLTNAKKYLSRRASALAWEQEIKGIDHSQEIANLKRAAKICWRLSWMT